MAANMTGLKQRKTIEEVIAYIQNDKTINRAIELSNLSN